MLRIDVLRGMQLEGATFFISFDMIQFIHEFNDR
jgi:hypothetical protein